MDIASAKNVNGLMIMIKMPSILFNIDETVGMDDKNSRTISVVCTSLKPLSKTNTHKILPKHAICPFMKCDIANFLCAAEKKPTHSPSSYFRLFYIILTNDNKTDLIDIDMGN